ncbi:MULTISPECIES: MerR family transcriptional regulator [unclassified Gilliamella]|uniref:MerR family transcriptional regulator n=1 Tax=unclassified Gilliamella TaxID=2685620 RepID=UPI00226A4919|nr:MULTISPECIES: MerR family transcriptional regulator [unclassified Gilliamella]MCX8641518.1 MerR family transcriptional regulator [Gilliamella sp. B3835]MCX8706733.1 MerR family transcriptional regulator [Gilliamella sp. B3783]MCX8708591.1 MerR family transcriptional regulator [Gilliamella sp. B3780]MCX8711121.1 MerR family transcriptional regulator [Gilliamella sp. B3468]MCX8713878.1 MerR family transcriptional regulator [Gilliamella sp. B3781]
MGDNSLKNTYDDFLSTVIVGIGEVSEMTKIPVRKLRYWEEKGIIKTVDPQSKSRQFDLANIKKIILIQELIDDGYSLDGAAKKVEERFAKIGSLMSLIQM